MLADTLAVLGLAAYAFEVFRTVQRFGVKRPGALGGVMLSPKIHVFMAVVMIVAFFLLAEFPFVPAYVWPAGALINGVYLVLALRYARRRGQGSGTRSGPRR